MFLPFQDTLYKATFLERVNQFILLCEKTDSNERITVHLQDPGRLLDLLIPGNTIYVSYHNEVHRKTKWTAELVTKPNTSILVSLRSTLPNKLIRNALQTKAIEELAFLEYRKQEYTYGGSRWDFLLQANHNPYLLEVKSVTMEMDGVGYFPDAPTKRGTKHVRELTEIQLSGHYQTGVLFVCQREDIRMVKPCHWIDPTFTEALHLAQNSGVEIRAVSCKLTLEGIYLGNVIPVEVSM